MKRAYGQYLFDPPSAIQDTFEASMEELAALLQRRALAESGRVLTWDEALVDASMSKLSADAQTAVRQGRCLHLFFAGDGFRDWLAAAAPPLGPEQMGCIRALLVGQQTVMLHFRGGDSTAYLLQTAGRVSVRTRKPVGADAILNVFRGRKLRTVYLDMGVEHDRGTGDPDFEDVICTVAGVAAYMQAFPDMVVPGIPADLKNPNHFRKAVAKTVSVHSRVRVSDGAIPHYCTGHFRYLQSKRYTTMRFQTIFVPGFFVNGKAKTVLSPDTVPA